jgi:hypothetical protein
MHNDGSQPKEIVKNNLGFISTFFNCCARHDFWTFWQRTDAAIDLPSQREGNNARNEVFCTTEIAAI